VIISAALPAQESAINVHIMHDVKQCLHVACAWHISLSLTPPRRHLFWGAAPIFNPVPRVSSNRRRCTFVAILLFVYDCLAFSLLSCICAVILVRGQGLKFCTILRYVMPLYMD